MVDMIQTPSFPVIPECHHGETRKKFKTRNGSRGSKWKALVEECLAEAWKAMSLDPISKCPTNLRQLLEEDEGPIQ
jgi:hypothetical protein